MKSAESSFAVQASAVTAAECVNRLRESGIVVIQGLGTHIDALTERTTELLKVPAILGSPGYYQKDPHKVLVELTHLGSEVLQRMLHPLILDIAEGAFGTRPRLQEAFVKHDFGDGELYFPVHAHTAADAIDRKALPPSIGFIHYLHDTASGAFCFAPGTHHLDTSHGGSPDAYPPETRKQIADQMRRFDGKKGDVVLFDHRGFHGPEQPCSVSRTVILGGFHNTKAFGDVVKTPFPVYPHCLTGLDERQLYALGLGASGPIYSDRHMHLYSSRKANPLKHSIAHSMLKAAFYVDLAMDKAKSRLRPRSGAAAE